MTTALVQFDRATPPDRLAGLVSPELLERWTSLDRSFHEPRLVVVSDDDGAWSGVALLTARPHTAYLKIVDVVASTAAGVAAVVAAAVEHALTRGAVQLKWEGWSVEPETAATLGFVPLLPPLVSGDGTDRPARGYVRWLTDAAVLVTEAPYYRQTTDFTCGAVAALSAQLHAGVTDATLFDRTAELNFWRGATNFPACEPVGLGVALKRSRPSNEIVIALDTERPVVVDFHPEQEREWRALLQRQSRADAAELGVPIDATRLSMDALQTAIATGRKVLLLMSLALMQNDLTPHWILCHGLAAGAVVVEDPWVETPNGDTWVDAHLLPIPAGELDAMSTMEADGYRGAVLVAVA